MEWEVCLAGKVSLKRPQAFPAFRISRNFSLKTSLCAKIISSNDWHNRFSCRKYMNLPGLCQVFSPRKKNLLTKKNKMIKFAQTIMPKDCSLDFLALKSRLDTFRRGKKILSSRRSLCFRRVDEGRASLGEVPAS